MIPTVPYLETGISNGSLFKNWIATPLSIGSTFRKRLQPYSEANWKATPVAKVPYLETDGSNCSPFKNCLQPPVTTVPF